MTRSANNTLESFLERIPDAARPFTIALLKRYPVRLRLSAPRKTKWGDYRYGKSYTPTVSVNSDLPPPLFLLTFMHEMAHHIVRLDLGRKVSAHGKEWKITFRTLMEPLLSPKVFDYEVLAILTVHMQNPKANLTSDQNLHALAGKLIHGELVTVADLSVDDVFEFRSRTFIRKQIVRKRIRCFCTENKKTYLFQPATPIEPI